MKTLLKKRTYEEIQKIRQDDYRKNYKQLIDIYICLIIRSDKESKYLKT